MLAAQRCPVHSVWPLAGHVSGAPPWVGSGASSGSSWTGRGASVSAHSEIDQVAPTLPVAPRGGHGGPAAGPGRRPRALTPAERPGAPAPSRALAVRARCSSCAWRLAAVRPRPLSGAASAAASAGPRRSPAGSLPAATPTRVIPAGLWPWGGRGGCGHSREVGHVFSLAVMNLQQKWKLGHTPLLSLEK